jgi:hypothetical protein
MDGYAKHEKGGEFVTYARLSAMGTNGFQEPAVGIETTGPVAAGTSLATEPSAVRSLRDASEPSVQNAEVLMNGKELSGGRRRTEGVVELPNEPRM